MKMKEAWKRITALGVACFMVLTSVDAGALTTLAADIQVQKSVKSEDREFPTGLKEIQWVERTESGDEIGIWDEKKLSVGYNSDWDRYSTNYYYNQLSEDKRIIWDKLDAMCLEYLTTEVDAVSYEEYGFFTESVENLPEGITLEEGMELVYMFLLSNPQYYFLESLVLYGGDFTGMYMSDVAIGIYDAFAAGSDRMEATVVFEEKIMEVIESIPENATEEEKLRTVHDYVVKKVDYNYDIIEGGITDEEEDAYFTQSAYSVFCGAFTVCTGYTEAMQILCNGLDIDAIGVTSLDHAWNKVRIYDTWYNVDATWADGGDENIYYEYYGRSDVTYQDDLSNNVYSHTIEEYLEEYMPVCSQDVENGTYTEPGIFRAPDKTLDAPVITVVPIGNKNLVRMTGTVEGADIYYTLDGTEPSVASAKAIKYENAFYVENTYEIMAIAVKDGYYDSAVAQSGVSVPKVTNVAADNRFYQKLTVSWDSLGSAVDGYEITVLDKDTKVRLKQVRVDNSRSSYAFDLSDVESGIALEIHICAYVGTGSEMKRSDETVMHGVVTKKEPLENMGLRWYVTNIAGARSLVVVYASDHQLYHYLEESGMDVYTLGNYTNGRYIFDSKTVPYDKSGYIIVCDKDLTTAWQEKGVSVGGTFVKPVLEPIADVNLHENQESTILEAKITNPMDNFDYRYQWYVSNSADGKATVIEGAVDSTYEAVVEANDVKYYFCRVTTEYGGITYVDSANADGRRTAVKGTADTEAEVKITIEEIEDQIYTGKKTTPALQIVANGVPLMVGRDYVVTYMDNINAGTARAVVTFIGNYSGVEEKKFTILPKELDETFEVTFAEGKEYTYTGEAITPELLIKVGGNVLVKDKDYTLTYSDNINAGTAGIRITYIGNYAGVSTELFTIVPMKIENLEIGTIEDQTYTGYEIIPEFLVSAGELEFAIGTDYDVEFAADVDNINVGEVKMTVVLKGNYEGQADAAFKILPLNVNEDDSVVVKNIADQKYTGKEIKPVVVVENGEFKLAEGRDYTLAYKNNTAVGTATVTITFKGNYAGTLTKSFKITNPVPQNITSSNVNVDEQKGYISKISIGTSVQGFIDSLNEKKYVTVVDKNGKKVEGSSALATGMKVTIMDGNKKVKEYSIIVTGDTNGDGKLNITDMIAVKASTLKKSDLTGVYAKAADVNGDGKVNITDFIKVKAAILKKDTITGVSAK